MQSRGKNFAHSFPFSAVLLGLGLAISLPAAGAAAAAAKAREAKASEVNKAIFVRLVAKPGQEGALAHFLQGAKPLVDDEPETALWFALRFDARTFAIFDAMPTEAGRQAHLAGKVAAALMAHAGRLLDSPPVIETADIIEKKVNKG